jgi:cell division initiation protein
MKLSPDMIREQRFKTRLSGFDRNEVIAFLLDMAEDMELLIEENSLLKGEVEASKRRQKDMEDLFLSVKQFSEERMKRAELEAKDVLAEAEKKASEIQQAAGQKLLDAEHRAQELQSQAMQKAREIIRETERMKQELERGLTDVRNKRASLMSELTSTLESYQAWIRTQGNRDQGNVV